VSCQFWGGLGGELFERLESEGREVLGRPSELLGARSLCILVGKRGKESKVSSRLSHL